MFGNNNKNGDDGKKKEPGVNDQDPPVAITQEQLDKTLNERFGSFEQGFKDIQFRLDNIGQPVNKQEPPAEDPAKKFDDQIKELDTQLKSYNKEFQDGLYTGTDTAAVMAKRDALMNKRAELATKKELALHNANNKTPDNSNLYGVIDNLADKVNADSMPHLKIPEVNKEYRALLDSLGEARIDPNLREACYQKAVGANFDVVFEKTQEANLRNDSDNDPANLDSPNNRSSRVKNQNEEKMTPESVWGEDAVRQYESVGHTADTFVQSLQGGYKDFADYTEKMKDYFD
jgi:hypothetical protein